jgi:hypothetical protein
VEKATSAVSSWSPFRARLPAAAIPSGIHIPRFPDMLRKSLWKSLSTWRQIFIALVMKLHFSKSTLGDSSGVDRRRVLAIGVLAKLDAALQLFHTSH